MIEPRHRDQNLAAVFRAGYQLTLLEIHKLLYFLQEARTAPAPFRQGNLRSLCGQSPPFAPPLEGHFTLGFADAEQAGYGNFVAAGCCRGSGGVLREHPDTSEPSLQV